MILPERDIGSAALRSDGRPRHRGLIIFIAVLILALTGYATWWYMLVEQTREHLDAWFADVRTAGHEASYDDLLITGFPSRIALDIQNLRFAHANGQWRINIPVAKAYGTPWQLTQIEGSIGVPVRIENQRGDHVNAFTVVSASNSFVVTLDGAGVVDLSMDEFVIADAMSSQSITADMLNLKLRGGDASIFMHASLAASGVTLPDPSMSPFGEKITSLETDVDLVVAPTRVGTLPEQLDIWRRDGGAIEVRRLSIRHGVLGLDGDGTITLDRNLQPEGAFGVSVSGFNPAIDALVAQGLVPEAESRLVKAALGLLAKVPPEGGPKRIEIPLTVQDQKLIAGPFPLMRIPRIYWE